MMFYNNPLEQFEILPIFDVLPTFVNRIFGFTITNVTVIGAFAFAFIYLFFKLFYIIFQFLFWLIEYLQLPPFRFAIWLLARFYLLVN